ncbi:MAG TPA: alpha/beta fold hydrolase [Flavobacterium sp.]|jgi:pimeloyl-ACP methyl ester carboxylesterase
MQQEHQLFSRIEGAGKPLIILHGFLGMSDNWKTLSGKFAANGFEVHALDLRNHGRSFHSEEFTYEAMVQDIYNYCFQHNLGPINLLGHSMGGKIAMFFAVNHPEKTEKLIVADIGPKYYAPHHTDILEALNAVDFSVSKERGEVDEVIKSYIPDFGTRQFLMKSVHRDPFGSLGYRFNLSVFTKNTGAIGKALSADQVFQGPTLFLRGETSRYILDEDFTLIRHHFPQSNIKTISKAGHWLHADNPNGFYEAAITFL